MFVSSIVTNNPLLSYMLVKEKQCSAKACTQINPIFGI